MPEPTNTTTEATKALDAAETGFLREVAAPRLESVTNAELLKHFADVWWNLCLWEKQRADAIDTKASGILGLASVASAIVAVGGTATQTSASRVVGAILFLVSAALALFALRVRDYTGFADGQVFKALDSAKAAAQAPTEANDPALIAYLQQVVMQRWLVYKGYKEASNDRAKWVYSAQVAAGAAIVAVCVSISRTYL
jgi:hypothetical protein